MMKRKQLATRLAIASMFLIHGVITGAWVPHIPLAQQRLGADLATFGLALLALAAGAVTAMPVAGSLIHKYGSARVTLATGILFCLAFPMPALAGTIGWFVAGLAIFGAAMGAMDVAMNAQALAYEKQIGKPVMSLFHGMYSAGAMGGAGLSALVLGQFSAQTHLAGTVVIGFATICVAAFFLLPADTDRGLAEKRFFAWPSRATIGLGSLCFLAYMSEGAVLDWSAIELRQKFSLSAHVAGIGYGAFAGGMALARFTGDALRSRFGPVALVRSERGSGSRRHDHRARRSRCGDVYCRLWTGGAGPRQHRAGSVRAAGGGWNRKHPGARSRPSWRWASPAPSSARHSSALRRRVRGCRRLSDSSSSPWLSSRPWRIRQRQRGFETESISRRR